MVLTVFTSKAHYDINLERSTTIICGDSATGKSLLVDAILQYNRNKKGSGIIIDCGIPVTTTPTIPDNETYFKSVAGSLIVLDESVTIKNPKELQRVARNYGCWLLLITRSDKGMFINTSVHSVLKFVRHGKHVTTEPMFIFDMPRNYSWNLVTEDKMSGNEFVNMFTWADTLDSNSKMGTRGDDLHYHTYFVDSAAFSTQMRIYYNKYRDGLIDFILPECFEEMLLHSSVFMNDKVVSLSLSDPGSAGANDAKVYTWESYYYNVICDALKRCCNITYSKSRVPMCLTIKCCISKEICFSWTNVRDKVRDILENCKYEFMYNYTDVIIFAGKRYHFNDLVKVVPGIKECSDMHQKYLAVKSYVMSHSELFQNMEV